MLATRGRDNSKEKLIRSSLHRQGLRFRVHRPVPHTRRTIDIAFPGARVAVFVDGCFWHGCPLHGTFPKSNATWWREKIAANQRRDSDTVGRLSELGWTVLRIWEHEDSEDAALKIEKVVRTRLTEAATARKPRLGGTEGTP
jgi:DNA mismatch endonuclease, patch repair protein